MYLYSVSGTDDSQSDKDLGRQSHKEMKIYSSMCVGNACVSADILGNKIASKFIGIKKTVNSVDVNLHFTCINVHIFHSIHSAIQL